MRSGHASIRRCVLGAAFGTVVISSLVSAQIGLSFQACGTTCGFTTSAAAIGNGTSTWATDADSDKIFATGDADVSLKRKLGKQAGVVCGICEDGVQCARSVALGAGTLITSYTYIPGDGTPATEGWECTMVYQGDYSVTCSTCPPL